MPKTIPNQKDKIASICWFINYCLVPCAGGGCDIEMIIFLYCEVFGICWSVCECLGETVEEINNAEVQIWRLCINEIWVWPLTALRINVQPFLSGKSNRGHHFQKATRYFRNKTVYLAVIKFRMYKWILCGAQKKVLNLCRVIFKSLFQLNW